MAGFLQQASELAGDVTFVFGNTKTGRTYQIIQMVKDRATTNPNQKVLWLSFGGLNFEGKQEPSWIVGQPTGYDNFHKELLVPLQTTGLKLGTEVITPNVIVLEGLDILAKLYVREQIDKRGNDSTRMVYGEVGQKLCGTLAILKSKTQALIVSMTSYQKVQVTGEAETKVPLNPDAMRTILPMASRVIYTSRKDARNQKGEITDVKYFVQTDTIKALNYQTGEQA